MFSDNLQSCTRRSEGNDLLDLTSPGSHESLCRDTFEAGVSQGEQPVLNATPPPGSSHGNLAYTNKVEENFCTGKTPCSKVPKKCCDCKAISPGPLVHPGSGQQLDPPTSPNDPNDLRFEKDYNTKFKQSVPIVRLRKPLEHTALRPGSPEPPLFSNCSSRAASAVARCPLEEHVTTHGSQPPS